MKRFLTNSFNQVIGKLTGKNKHEAEYEFEILPESEFELKPLAELDKIEFSSRDYEKTSDFQNNISLYEKGLEKIRAKYREHVLDAYYLNGEDLIRRESERDSFCKKVNILPEELEQKIDDYCRKNKIAYQELYIPKENVDPAIKEELEQVIAAQAELEKIKFLVRDDNCSEEWLEKGVLLAKTYRSAEEVAILKKMLAEAKAKGEGNFVRNKVKFKITHTILNDLASDINSGGERREKTKYASNWEKKLNLFKSELEKRGIYLDERYEGHRIHEAEIMQTWDKINEQVKNENTKARSFEKVLDEVLRKHPQIGLEYHSAVSEEQTGIKKTRNLEEYLEDAQQFAGKTVRDDGGEQISSEKRIIRYLLKTADERKQWGSDIGAK